jgi:zinc protease
MIKHSLNLWSSVALLAPLALPLLLATLDLTPRAVLAQSTPKLNITQFTLENGLKVILVEDHSAPTVAVSVWYRVGGANDPQGRSGFAHLFEHMMFQGSANVAPGRHAELVNAAGGNDNASTGIDRTNYFEALPSNQLPLALWLEADRMRSLVVNDANFRREREVVKEEYRQRIGNQPYGEASLKLQTMSFDYPPYQRPVIGSIEDLDQATVDQVRAFHAEYYKPNNATLTVAGDIDAMQTKGLIQQYFGPIPKQEAAPLLPAYSFTLQVQAQSVTIPDKLARVPAEFVAYRIPPRGQPDYYPLGLLSRILGEGDSSRLAQALVDTGLASDAAAFTDGNVGPSQLDVTLVPNPNVDLSKLEDVYYREVNRIVKEGVSADELTKAVNQILTRRISGLQSSLGLAENVQAANFYIGDPQALFSELDRYRAVKSADIQRVAAMYLTLDTRNVIKVEVATPAPAGVPAHDAPITDTTPLTYTPSSGRPAPQATEPMSATEGVVTATAQATPPPALPVREFRLPAMSETTLPNGLRVVTIPLHELPLVTARLVLIGGESTAPANLAGLSDFTANLLTRGTTTRTAQQIATTIEQTGGDLSTSASNDQIYAGISVLSEYTDLGFNLLGDVVLNPTFPQGELDTERERELNSLQSSLADPGDVANRALKAIVYGAHPYGRSTTEQSIKAITRGDIETFYQAQRNPKSALLIVAGDIAAEEALRQARSVFGAWVATSVPVPPAFPAPPERKERRIYLVDRPDSTQAEVMVGEIALRGSSPERFAAQVANQVLGGGSTSRLFMNLRERHGYTYGVGSAFSLPPDLGQFLVEGAVRNQVIQPALQAILDEMEQMRSTPVPAPELKDAKAHLIGGFALRLERLSDLIDQVGSLKIRGLPLDSLSTYAQSIDQVDEAAVQNTSRQYIVPDSAAIVVVGDASQIRNALTRIAPVTMVNSDGQEIKQ